MSIYLSLGSNIGERRKNLAEACKRLDELGLKITRRSSPVEGPAMLPQEAEAEWDMPFINLMVEAEGDIAAADLLKLCKRVEAEMGRDNTARRWSPRPVDIDIIAIDDQEISTADLIVPHQAYRERDFVLSPWCELAPHHRPDGKQTLLQMTQRIKPVPLWMAILNATPDSFSQDGYQDENNEINIHALDAHLDDLFNHNIQIIDIGAESTRPNAEEITWQTEWQRLQPFLEHIQGRCQQQPLAPRLSVDSRHPEVIARALDYGVTMINDVSGLGDPQMQELAKTPGITTVAMHSLTVPADRNVILPSGEDPLKLLHRWLADRAEMWQRAGVDLSRIIFDPGIGFGKTALQSMTLVQNCETLRNYGFPLLIGHSRKSFTNGFTRQQYTKRDVETLGISFWLFQQGVDILRIHNPIQHHRAYLAWRHINRHLATY